VIVEDAMCRVLEAIPDSGWGPYVSLLAGRVENLIPHYRLHAANSSLAPYHSNASATQPQSNTIGQQHLTTAPPISSCRPHNWSNRVPYQSMNSSLPLSETRKERTPRGTCQESSAKRACSLVADRLMSMPGLHF
jgi:hypothetical protein